MILLGLDRVEKQIVVPTLGTVVEASNELRMRHDPVRYL
jgi:hypothetical protein